MSNFYIYCRFWERFTDAFPYEQFQHLADDVIGGAIADAVAKKFKATPSLRNKWRQALKQKETQWDENERKRVADHFERAHWAAGILTWRNAAPPPNFKPLMARKMPAPPDDGLGLSLNILGWYETDPLPTRRGAHGQFPIFPRRHIIGVAHTEDDARVVVTALASQASANSSHNVRFGYLDSSRMGSAEQLLCNREVEYKSDAIPVVDGADDLMSELLRWSTLATDLLARLKKNVPPRELGGDSGVRLPGRPTKDYTDLLRRFRESGLGIKEYCEDHPDDASRLPRALAWERGRKRKQHEKNSAKKPPSNGK
jgi:hypothetical protein